MAGTRDPAGASVPASGSTSSPSTPTRTQESSDEPTRLGEALRSKQLPQLSPEEQADLQRRREERGIAAEKGRREQAWRDISRMIGRRYTACSLSDFECYAEGQREALAKVRRYADGLVEHVRRGDGLVLFGPSGTGKDHLLAALMRGAVLVHGMSVVWRNGTDLFGEFRDSMRRETRERDVIQQFIAPDVLCLSDPVPPWGQLSEYQASQMFRIIDGRYRDAKPTWCSLNVAKGREAEERLSAAIVDRLRDGALTLHCNWPSYRQPEGK